jgi:hypothetical protein
VKLQTFKKKKKTHFLEYITKLDKKNIDANIKSQETKDLNKFFFSFLETNGKIHCKEKHHKEKAKGQREEKSKSTKA